MAIHCVLKLANESSKHGHHQEYLNGTLTNDIIMGDNKPVYFTESFIRQRYEQFRQIFLIGEGKDDEKIIKDINDNIEKEDLASLISANGDDDVVDDDDDDLVDDDDDDDDNDDYSIDDNSGDEGRWGEK